VKASLTVRAPTRPNSPSSAGSPPPPPFDAGVVNVKSEDMCSDPPDLRDNTR
jgi:hypothetical protein